MPTPAPHSPTPHPPRFLIPGWGEAVAGLESLPLSDLPLPWNYLILAGQMAQNYQMVLPEHPEWLDETVDWADDEALGLATLRFLERVNEHCFPVETEIMIEDIGECAHFLAYAPLLPSGFYFWDDWREYAEPIPFLYYLHLRAWAREHNPQEIEGMVYGDVDLPDDLELTELAEVINRMVTEGRLTLPTPLEALPHLMRMVTKTSRNFWLDCSEEELGYGEWIGWDDLAVLELTLDWQKAAPIVEQVNLLLQWVGKETRPRLATIADILKKAHLYRQSMKDSETVLK